ncbi:hypothetical protein N7474_009807 [Penicillium riverlandense]|uniref:uncharacterized protein n=1 Tax=Penicillium riverlandense TaxID=1903569 RepID=UPI0025490737|nr:uncharacterized protein N7474_009807 [Penicillium riverlandense]KAJ5808538.1 hypothetical protein N7474_009807 [Penicillium riverlandense]
MSKTGKRQALFPAAEEFKEVTLGRVDGRHTQGGSSKGESRPSPSQKGEERGREKERKRMREREEKKDDSDKVRKEGEEKQSREREDFGGWYRGWSPYYGPSIFPSTLLLILVCILRVANSNLTIGSSGPRDHGDHDAGGCGGTERTEAEEAQVRIIIGITHSFWSDRAKMIICALTTQSQIPLSTERTQNHSSEILPPSATPRVPGCT